MDPARSDLDVGFDKDRARNRRDHGSRSENLTILQKLALNVLRTASGYLDQAQAKTIRWASQRSLPEANALVGRIEENVRAAACAASPSG